MTERYAVLACHELYQISKLKVKERRENGRNNRYTQSYITRDRRWSSFMERSALYVERSAGSRNQKSDRNPSLGRPFRLY